MLAAKKVTNSYFVHYEVFTGLNIKAKLLYPFENHLL